MHSPLQIRHALKQIGFSNNEIKIIVFLLCAKRSTALNISLKTGISFASTQYCLSNLLSLEIVYTIPNKENYFEIVSQNEFLEWIEKTRKENEIMYEESKNDILKFFLNTHNQNTIRDAHHFKGKNEVIKIYEDILQTKKDIYSWTDLGGIYKNLGNYTDQFIKKRVSNKIKTHAIKPKTREAIIDLKDENRHRNVILVDKLNLNGEIRIYGKKITFISFDKSNPEGFVFEKEIISNIFKNIFKNYWAIFS